MKLKNDYPLIYKKINRFLLIRKIILILYFIALVISVIVNISIGGHWWCIYVLGGEVITYYAFFNKPLINNIIIKRISIIILVVILYLKSIDLINNTNWSDLVIDIIAFSLLVLQIIFFFINYEQHKNKIVLMLTSSCFSLIFCLLAFFKLFPINWAIIVTGSVGLFNLLFLFSFYFKTTTLELKKYFSLK